MYEYGVGINACAVEVLGAFWITHQLTPRTGEGVCSLKEYKILRFLNSANS